MGLGGPCGDIAQRLTVYSQWPDTTRAYTYKVPTVLAYDVENRLVAWGARAVSSSATRVEYFKLGLEAGTSNHYRVEGDHEIGVLGGFITDPNWRHPSLPHKAPVDLVAEYLSQVHQHFSETYLPNNYGPSFRHDEGLAYVMTVPAIWQERTKDLLRQAAIRAGINDSLVEFISEPEAAALYCATICNNVGLETGDCFLVCDAGGGTVVILGDP
jgi:molecular chaperone DnaK (HSP70)